MFLLIAVKTCPTSSASLLFGLPKLGLFVHVCWQCQGPGLGGLKSAAVFGANLMQIWSDLMQNPFIVNQESLVSCYVCELVYEEQLLTETSVANLGCTRSHSGAFMPGS